MAPAARSGPCVSVRFRSRRQRGRKILDLLIAAAAEEAGLTLLHYDGDFDLIVKRRARRADGWAGRHHRLTQRTPDNP